MKGRKHKPIPISLLLNNINIDNLNVIRELNITPTALHKRAIKQLKSNNLSFKIIGRVLNRIEEESQQIQI